MTHNCHPFRILIVDDERRNWAGPMKDALEDCARERGDAGKLAIDIAINKRQAESYLGRCNYHLTSLDMRLPDREGEPLSVDAGLELARRFPWVGFPKLLIYSQTLRVKEFQSNPTETMQVLRIPTDHYAKPTGSDADRERNAVETITVKEWGGRVLEYLLNDNLNFQSDPAHGKRLTMIGAYLRFGVASIPPLLAAHLQTLENNWTKRTSDRVEAALGFIEATTRVAFVQSAVLCQAQGEQVELPGDERIETCLNSLEMLHKKLSGWNWGSYLTSETLQALRFGHRERNDMAHSAEPIDPQKRWSNIRSPLQYAMDLAAYWVQHPLALDLRPSRDGWSAELLAGTINPCPRHPLPQAMQFPVEAASDGVWQNVWRLTGEHDEPERKAISWENWLQPDHRSGKEWWFPIYRTGRGIVHMDLVAGRTQTMP